MELYQVDFIIAALFTIAGSIFYTGDKEEIGLAWMLIAACFIGHASYLAISGSVGICYAG